MRSNNCNRYRNWHQISIHPSLAGRDLLGADCHQVLDISIHPSLAGRDARCRQLCINVRISIHPSLAGRDRGHGQSGAQERISIHPSLAGRDLRPQCLMPSLFQFQSTRPSRDGTLTRSGLNPKTVFQSTRPSRDGTAVH